MNSFKESRLPAVAKSMAAFFMFLPLPLSMALARWIGRMGYVLLPKKRAVVYANLKAVFSQESSPERLRVLTKEVFVNFAQSFAELMCLPKIKRLGFENFVHVEGREYLEEGLKGGRGIIFLAIHSGNWELASVIGSLTGYPYHIVVNEQSKTPQLDVLLNEYRKIVGADVIVAGTATKDIIRAIRNNEIIALVLDQGGREGAVVPFLGKTASMSTGAIRLALKYGCAVCPVWITRDKDGTHTLKASELITLTKSGDLEQDILTNVAQAAQRFDGLIRTHPSENMWFYKIFKYGTDVTTLILDDGRTGHLRQSEALARSLKHVLRKKGKSIVEHTLLLEFKGPWAAKGLSLLAFMAQYLSCLQKEEHLKYFLTPSSYQGLVKVKADYIISCGSKAAGINFILSKNHMAKSISILTPGLLSLKNFHMAVMPEHDTAAISAHPHVVRTKVAPNLIDAAYLKEQGEGLMRHYSHLKGNVRTKIGVLLGGNTKGVVFDESKMRQLMGQIKEAALHYNADILLTTSRRTPPGIENIVTKELKNFDRCLLCIIANQRNVPESVGGILHLSDLVIVSGESISMVSEALTSGKKTIVFAPGGTYGEKPQNKYERFVMKLHDEGYIMLTSVKDLSEKISQLLGRKITLKTLDEERRIQSILEKIV